MSKSRVQLETGRGEMMSRYEGFLAESIYQGIVSNFLGIRSFWHGAIDGAQNALDEYGHVYGPVTTPLFGSYQYSPTLSTDSLAGFWAATNATWNDIVGTDTLIPPALQGVSLSIWFTDNLLDGTHRTLFGKNVAYRLSAQSGLVKFTATMSDLSVVVATAVVPYLVDTWTNATGVFDKTANEIRLYVNGELVATTSTGGVLALNLSGNNLLIGGGGGLTRFSGEFAYPWLTSTSLPGVFYWGEHEYSRPLFGLVE